MTLTKTKYREIIRALYIEISNREIIRMWNQYVEVADLDKKLIVHQNYPDTIDAVLKGYLPSEVMRIATDDDFDRTDDYFVMADKYKMRSFNYFDDYGSPVSLETLAKYMDDNNDSLDNVDIATILNGD